MGGDLAALIPAGGVAAVLAIVVGYLLRANHIDRMEYLDAVDRAEKRADEYLSRHRQTQEVLDTERASRRRTEDALAEAVRELAGLRDTVERQSRRIAEQTEQIEALRAEVARLNGHP